MNRFLLVGSSRQVVGSSRQAWRDILKDAVRPLGELDVCRETETFVQVEKTKYAVVIVDAGEVSHLEELVFRLRGQMPSLRIIVVSASPTWQLARQVFLSGATDYILKYADKRKLSAFLAYILDHPASPADPAIAREI
jgi:DNA-binding NarL/FixJ family response regulator